MHLRRIAVTMIIFVSLALNASPVFAAGSIPSAEVVSLLRSAKIVKADFPIRAMIDEKDMTIFTRRPPKASESDVKIDAMLIAKTLFDSYASQVRNVNVLFSTQADPEAYTRISITQQAVKDFGSGKTSETQLLQSLQAVHEDDRTLVPQSQAELQSGPLMEQRMALQDQIQVLKQGGTDTKPFELLFDQVELAIKQGNSEQARTQLSSLAEKLEEQVELRKAANVPILANGGGKSFGSAGFGNSTGTAPEPYEKKNLGMQRMEAIVDHYRTVATIPGFVIDDLTRAQDAAAQENWNRVEGLLEDIEHSAGLPDTFKNSVPRLATIKTFQRKLLELQQQPGANQTVRQRKNNRTNWREN